MTTTSFDPNRSVATLTIGELETFIGRAIRTHRGIENQLHWVLDVTWGEDKSRIRRGHGGENMALLRRLAISVLNQETALQE